MPGGEEHDGDHVAGQAAGPCAQHDVGGVRAESQTFSARPSARSYAISMPEQPWPTTSTSLSLERLGVPVIPGVDQLPREAVAPRPVRERAARTRSPWRPRPGARAAPRLRCRASSVRSSGRFARLACPASGRSILAGVAVEVVDELVARGEHRRALREPAARQVRVGAAGVEPEPVVARPPGGGDIVGLVHQKRAQAPRPSAPQRRPPRPARHRRPPPGARSSATIAASARAVRTCP